MSTRTYIRVITAVEPHPDPEVTGCDLTTFFVFVPEGPEIMTEDPDPTRVWQKHIDILVCQKQEDGTPRYQVGQLALFVPVGSVVPEYLIRQGYWDTEKDRPGLDGNQRNRVKPRKVRGVVSAGIHFAAPEPDPETGRLPLTNGAGETQFFKPGDDVTDFLGIMAPAALTRPEA